MAILPTSFGAVPGFLSYQCSQEPQSSSKTGQRCLSGSIRKGRIDRSLVRNLNTIPMLNNASSLEPIEVQNRSLVRKGGSTEDLCVHPAKTIRVCAMEEGNVGLWPHLFDLVFRAGCTLPDGKGVVLDEAGFNILERLGYVLLDVESFDELVPEKCLGRIGCRSWLAELCRCGSWRCESGAETEGCCCEERVGEKHFGSLRMSWS